MVFIGVGNTGAGLAYSMDQDSVLLSTAIQDTANFPKAKNIFTISKDGASKRFKQGERIWQENEENLKDILSAFYNEKVVIFSSLGGGSGSSSLQFLSKILLDNKCKVLIIGILPFKKEINPPLANAVQSISSIMPFINKVSLLIFDNSALIKKYEGDWSEVNDHIITRVDQMINLIEKYSYNEYSPLTLDQSELDSVIFGGGFVDMSSTFLEDSTPKFEYGSLDKKTKNCLIAMFVDRKTKKDVLNEYHTLLTNVMNKISSRITNSRMIPGILRGDVEFSNSEDQTVNDRCYLTVASGLSIEKYMAKIEKLRDEAMKRAEAYSETNKSEKLIDSRETRKLDI